VGDPLVRQLGRYEWWPCVLRRSPKALEGRSGSKNVWLPAKRWP
jgi:hypothetical protein